MNYFLAFFFLLRRLTLLVFAGSAQSLQRRVQPAMITCSSVHGCSSTFAERKRAAEAMAFL